jgi:hypothetical protein
MAGAEFNSLREEELHNLAVLGLNGVRRLVTGGFSKLGEKFVFVRAFSDSTFTCKLGGGGDKTFTGSLKEDCSLLLPMSDIKDITGDLMFYKANK